MVEITTADAGPRAWLMLAAGADRQHGGNDGYDDQPDAYYTWDSTVANARAVKIGDKIAIWDKRALIGASIIEDIEVAPREKVVYRCRHCGMAGIKPRSTMAPRFKCYKCGEVFDDPIARIVTVDEHRSRHDAAWQELDRCLDGRTLRSLCASPKSQLSLRLLRWEDFARALADVGRAARLLDLDVRASGLSGGHRRTLVRVRLGQAPFRARLLARQGTTCAFTGSAPAAALEAGHLYSYALVGEHDEHGGLLLRRDIHRLFDRGDLAVNPKTLRIDVRPELLAFETYAALHGKPLAVSLSARQVRWLVDHWRQYRTEPASSEVVADSAG